MISVSVFSVDVGKDVYIIDLLTSFYKDEKGVRFNGSALYVEYGSRSGWAFDFLYLSQYVEKLKTWWTRERG